MIEKLRQKFEYLSVLSVANVSLRSECTCNDLLAEVKHFNLTTQKQNINIISIVDSSESTEYNYLAFAEEAEEKSILRVFN